jgi:hypothetical protein
MAQPSDYLDYFNQYLDQLARELEAYPSEDTLWMQPPGITNSAGNLALHLLGNLNHFIGAALGESGYKRNRSLEFAIKEIPRSQILAWTAKTKAMLHLTLSQIEDLNGPYPGGYRPEEGSVANQLNRLLSHLAYHCGQINYHRRLLATS